MYLTQFAFPQHARNSYSGMDAVPGISDLKQGAPEVVLSLEVHG